MSHHTRSVWPVLLACIPLHSMAQLAPGDDAPQQLGRTRTGEAINLADGLGKVQAVTFWASWCGPCRLELPMLEKLQRALGPERIRIVAVSIEDRDSFKQATRQMGDWKLTLSSDAYKSAFTAYKGKGIPYLSIISKTGKIEKVFVGYSEDSVKDVIAAVVDEANK